MKGSIKPSVAPAPYTPPKSHKRQGDKLYSYFNGKIGASYNLIIDENSEGFFVIGQQSNGATRTYMTTVYFIGKELVEL